MTSVPLRSPPHANPWSDPRVRVPSAEVWAAMSPARDEAAGRLESARAAMAELLLRQLAARGVLVTEEHRAKITACDDLDLLVRWLERAPSAASADDLFSVLTKT